LGLLRDVLLFVIGLGWCVAMFRRGRSDLDRLLDSRNVRDWALISALWGITAFVLVCMVAGTLGVARSIGHG
jgi:hypothetical protein